MTREFDYERRKQQRLRKLGTQTPQCVVCGNPHWECLQLHHIEGQAFGSTLAIVCANDHARLSVTQYGHPLPEAADQDIELMKVMRLLSGFADLLELVVAKLREMVCTIATHSSPAVGV